MAPYLGFVLYYLQQSPCPQPGVGSGGLSHLQKAKE